ncbi:MAG TPA: DinB family protein [Caldimonas sp.]|nr:DinB family protein [Caldimonas sp.]
MISRDWCVTMARYNEWMNRRLYAACAPLGEAELRRDRGAFFRSIHATLDHIVYADLAFLSRFTGDPPEAPPLGVELHGDFASLRATRERLDARLLAWCGTLEPDWLAGDLGYASKVDGVHRTRPRWLLVTHLFNHQAHHRGQVTTLLSQSGVDMGSTDLPFMP